jgi:hypothetical protein
MFFVERCFAALALAAAGLSVPLSRMSAKSKNRCGSTRTTRKVEDENEDDQGKGKNEGKGCVPCFCPYSLTTNYCFSARSKQ